jgi:hypothetical protein
MTQPLGTRRKAALIVSLALAALSRKSLRMRALLLATAVVLTSAAAAAQDQARRTMGFETYVVVAPAADEASAMPDAERHCAQYSRFANFRRMDGAKAIFDCGLAKIDHRDTGGRQRPGGLY